MIIRLGRQLYRKRTIKEPTEVLLLEVFMVELRLSMRLLERRRLF